MSGLTQPVPVLNYDPRPQGRRWSNWLKRLPVILLCGMFGAVLGRAQATSYVSVGYLSVASGPNAAIVTASPAQHAAAIVSPANLTGASLMLRTQRGPSVSPAAIARQLHTLAIPQSNQIAVSFNDDDPRVAAIVAQAVLKNYAASTPSVTIVMTGVVPTVAAHGKLFLLGGFVIGATLGMAIAALRWR